MKQHEEAPGSAARWVLGETHPIYGEVQMMGVLGGEAYRWFAKDNLVSMIPLSILLSHQTQTFAERSGAAPSLSGRLLGAFNNDEG
ncbi:hypothetical protein [Methylocaldum gracile]|jgi:hypothetical protein|uniref:hypothetical protein n=1 Tax=Methylocaldum sp. 0917 TaxID=2485163 RepID=UPI00106173FB